jgi:hypothetical protein
MVEEANEPSEREIRFMNTLSKKHDVRRENWKEQEGIFDRDNKPYFLITQRSSSINPV